MTSFSLNTDVQKCLADFLDNASLLDVRQVNRGVSRSFEAEFLVTVHSLRTLADFTGVPRLTARLRKIEVRASSDWQGGISRVASAYSPKDCS